MFFGELVPVCRRLTVIPAFAGMTIFERRACGAQLVYTIESGIDSLR